MDELVHMLVDETIKEENVVKMMNVASQTPKCDDCDFAAVHGPHQCACCSRCECEAIYEAGYRKQEATAREIVSLITKIYGHHNDRGPEETALAQEIVTAIGAKYGR